jgi:hypothetical protein
MGNYFRTRMCWYFSAASFAANSGVARFCSSSSMRSWEVVDFFLDVDVTHMLARNMLSSLFLRNLCNNLEICFWRRTFFCSCFSHFLHIVLQYDWSVVSTVLETLVILADTLHVNCKFDIILAYAICASTLIVPSFFLLWVALKIQLGMVSLFFSLTHQIGHNER